MNPNRLPGWSADFLRQLGNVRTVIDVGVLDGTPALYEAFPEAYLVLFEPQPSARLACERILKQRASGGEFHPVALTDVDGAGVLHVLPSTPAGSSLLRRPGHPHEQPVTVETARLDTVFPDGVRGTAFEDDVLLKLDVEGGELAAIRGAQRFLRDVRFCIAEVRVQPLHAGSYGFAEFIELMARAGFAVLDVLTVTRHGDRPGARILDVVFVNNGGR